MAMKFAEKFLNMMTLNNDADDDYDEYEEDYEEVEDTQEPEEVEEPVYEEEEEEEEEETPVAPTHTSSFHQEPKENKQPILNFKHRARDIDEKKASEPEKKEKRILSFQGIPEGESEIVKVSKPQEFNDAQKIVDELKQGKTIVVNLEGLEISQAQRIMDFVGGASYIIDGSLNAISNNIFIAAPDNIEVSGDLKSEIVNSKILSPELG